MKKIKLFGFALLAFTLGLGSCKKKDTGVKKDAVEIPKVKIQSTAEREVEQTYEYTATVQPESKNSIAPAAPGRIRNILVEVGDHVAKGQKIVQMDVVNLSNSETQIENMKKMYNRVQELYKVGGASQQELDNAKLQLDIAQANLKNLSENTYLLSPISGVVTERNYDSGDMYSAQRPVLVVMNTNQVKLVVNVSEGFYAQVKTGMPVKVGFDVFGKEAFSGKINLVYPTIDERTRTFGSEIRVNNPGGKIKPGMFARVTMEFGKAKRVVVPDLAVVKQVGSGARFVFAYNGGKVQYKQVELGRRIDSDYEILSGLNAGEQVVVAGQSKLVDGTSVKVME
ncbi:MAG TPA: efflux RND transporter periplasmic adaptor subunit [Paludibacter sp.]|nr:efflux RND transporter periplasmic adaptor subunit [Paludibacter sp.]